MYDSMVFYRSFYEAIKDLEPEMQGRIYSAIFAYALDDQSPDLTGVERSIFTLIKPQIDANNRRKENGKKGAKFGDKGGRPAKDNPKETPKKPLKNPKETPRKPLDNPKETPNVNVNANVNANENVVNAETPPAKISCGIYNNVRLTEDEYQALIDAHPTDYADMIDNLSAYMKSKGKYYADHFATMMAWKREDERKGKEQNKRPPEHGSAEDLHQFYDMVDEWAREMEQKEQEVTSDFY